MPDEVKQEILQAYARFGNIQTVIAVTRLPRPTIKQILIDAGVWDSTARAKKAHATKPDLKKRQPVLESPMVERQNPLLLASQVLPGFNRDTMTYRGRIWSVDDIMRETNRQRIIWGMPQIDYSPNWVV